VTVAACAVSPTGRRQLALVSEDSAIVASEEAYAMQIGDLRKAGKIVSESSSVARRVDAITGRLVAQAILMRPETADWKWSIEVIEDPEMVNAWCMAGGRMAIYTGLIQKLDPTDDELAGLGARDQPRARESHRGAHVRGDSHQCRRRVGRRSVRGFASRDEHGRPRGRARDPNAE